MPDIFINPEPKEKVEHKEKKATKADKKKKDLKKILLSHDGFDTKVLSAFRYYPDETNFLNKDPEEEIILLLRKHPITNVPWILISVVMLFAPGILSIFPLLSSLPSNFQFIAIVLWYLITTAYVFEKFLSWFFNVNIVTDERLFDVDFLNLIYREMTDANIDKIQDVTVRMGSVIRTVFNYGDVIIQTAGEVPRIVFDAVPLPDKAARILRELRIQEEQEAIEGRVR